MESSIEYISKRLKLQNEAVLKTDNYQNFVESIITRRYVYVDEDGPYGMCTMIDKFNSIINCTYDKGKMDGLLVVTRYDELIHAYRMNKGIVELEIDLSHLQRYRFLELSSATDRFWEGDVLNGIPYGWGEEVDINNRLLYSGFRIGNENVCYGTCYNSETGLVEYEGNWCFGKRWGHGRSFTPEGVLEYDGEWLNGQKVTSYHINLADLSLRMFGIHTCICDLQIGDDCGLSACALQLQYSHNLRILTIGCDSFTNISTFSLLSLPRLEYVSIGANSCENVVFTQFQSTRMDVSTN